MANKINAPSSEGLATKSSEQAPVTEQAPVMEQAVMPVWQASVRMALVSVAGLVAAGLMAGGMAG